VVLLANRARIIAAPKNIAFYVAQHAGSVQICKIYHELPETSYNEGRERGAKTPIKQRVLRLFVTCRYRVSIGATIAVLK
jgi:hypothetical protein